MAANTQLTHGGTADTQPELLWHHRDSCVNLLACCLIIMINSGPAVLYYFIVAVISL